jgi:hypothetical protein
VAIEKFLSKIMSRDRDRRFGSAPEALDAWRKVCRVMGNARRRQPAPSTQARREDQTDVTAGSFTEGGPPIGGPVGRRR